MIGEHTEELIKKNISNQGISYMFNNAEDFYETAYKILRNHQKSGIIKCSRLFQNGKIKLIYHVPEYPTLKNQIVQMNQKDFIRMLSNLEEIFAMIRENGFLRCENTSADMDKIFINTKDHSVYVICIPVKEATLYSDVSGFYEVLRQNILDGTRENPMLSLEEVYRLLYVREKKEPEDRKQPHNSGQNQWDLEKGLALYARDTKRKLSFLIHKSEFLIGKKRGNVDGLIEQEDTVSRIHCKFSKEDQTWFLQDMGSLNGTFVNGKKLCNGQKQSIRKGDIIRIAGIEFVAEGVSKAEYGKRV